MEQFTEKEPTLKITEIKIYLANPGVRRPILVKVLTDEGIHGVGEAALAYGTGQTAAAGMIKDLAEKTVLGKDPFRIEAIWADMYDDSFWTKGGGPVVFAGISAIEIALWDIKGKALNVPIYEMLGGKCRDSVPVYANGWSYYCVEPKDFARQAKRVVADGYKALKMYPLASPKGEGKQTTLQHVKRRTITREAEDLAVERVCAVRDAIGPQIDLMIDLSCELTTEAVIRLARRLLAFNLLFIEEPVDAFDVDALEKVSKAVAIPIAVGERLYTRYGFREVLQRHAADLLQPDVGTCGGILELKKIAAMAEAYNMRVLPHNCGSPVCTAASLQVDACITNIMAQEIFPYREPEFYALANHAYDLDAKDGFIQIPDAPGLGVDLVEAQVAPLLWASCTAS
jgi:galactonate dehydratase